MTYCGMNGRCNAALTCLRIISRSMPLFVAFEWLLLRWVANLLTPGPLLSHAEAFWRGVVQWALFWSRLITNIWFFVWGLHKPLPSSDRFLDDLNTPYDNESALHYGPHSFNTSYNTPPPQQNFLNFLTLLGKGWISAGLSCWGWKPCTAAVSSPSHTCIWKSFPSLHGNTDGVTWEEQKHCTVGILLQS